MGVSVAAACLARGCRVVGIDIDKSKIEALRDGRTHTNEKEAEAELRKGLEQKHLSLSTKLEAATTSDLIFIGVQTPEHEGTCDYSVLVTLLKELAPLCKPQTPLIIGSTLFPNAIHDVVIPALGRHADNVNLIYQPVFLRAGCGMHDYLNPGKSVFGVAEPSKVPDVIHRYLSVVLNNPSPLAITGFEDAEWIKLIHNTFMCVKINFANEVGLVIDSFGIPGAPFLRRLFSEYARALFSPLMQPASPSRKDHVYSQFLTHITSNRKFHYLSQGQTASAITTLSALPRTRELSVDEETEQLKREFPAPFERSAAPEPLLAFTLSLWEATIAAFQIDFQDVTGLSPERSQNLLSLALTENENGRLLTASHMIPGPPFSGPCLPKDSDILAGMVEKMKASTQKPYLLLNAAKRANDNYKDHIFKKWVDASAREPIGLIGVSFRSDCPEYRFSLGSEMIHRARREVPSVKVMAHDPWLAGISKRDFDEIARGDERVESLYADVRYSFNEVITNCHSIIVNMPLMPAQRKTLDEKALIDLFPIGIGTAPRAPAAEPQTLTRKTKKSRS